MKSIQIKSLLVAGVVLALTGCSKHSKPYFTYMPDMHYTKAIKAQTQGALLAPPAGTIARNEFTYPYKDLEAAAKNVNPLKRTTDVLNRGKAMFNTYCIVCHGPYGEGDGNVVPKFPRPPSLQSDKIKGYPDGKIFHVITVGQNLMSSYASQIAVEDRWAIIHYIRALQRAKNPTPDDLKSFEN